jgi:hypothetical protein
MHIKCVAEPNRNRNRTEPDHLSEPSPCSPPCTAAEAYQNVLRSRNRNRTEPDHLSEPSPCSPPCTQHRHIKCVAEPSRNRNRTEPNHLSEPKPHQNVYIFAIFHYKYTLRERSRSIIWPSKSRNRIQNRIK